MPWDVFEKEGRHCVYKVDDNDQPVGDSLGCHDSREEAMAQVEALHASEANKAVSYDQLRRQVQQAAYEQFGAGRDFWPYVTELFDEYAILEMDDMEYWQIPYTISGDIVEFAKRDQWQQVEQQQEWMEKAAKARSGAIVALMIPPEVAGQLALPGGEVPEELHITLAYLGEAADFRAIDARRELQRWAACQPPITGLVNGVGKFNTTSEENGRVAFYASFDAPSLPIFRQALMGHLEYCYPLEAVLEHGFTPHITLAYVDPDAPLPVESVEQVEVTFSQVSLLYAGERYDFDLLGEPYYYNGTTVKAVAGDGEEWLLDVLGAPFGGPLGGKDSDGDYFDARTDFWLTEIGKRPIVHYHGWDTKGRPTDPEIIGEELGYEAREDGIWFRVLLDQASETAADIWEAAQKGLARASSGAIQHLIRPLKKAIDGHISLWPIAELSLMDTRKGNIPVNSYAVALPAMKAVFEAAHLDFEFLTDSRGDGAETSTGAEPPVATAGQVKQSTEENSEMPEITLEAIEAYLQKREAAAAEKARIKQLEQDAEELKTLKAQIAEAEASASEDGRQQIKRLPNPAPSEAEPPAQASVKSRWDGFSLGQLGMAYDMLKGVGIMPSSELYRALHAKALKAVDDPNYIANQILRDKKGNILREFSPDESVNVVKAVKAINPMQMADKKSVKAGDEVMYSTQSSYGDQWVPPMWSPELWDLVRNGAPVLRRFRQIEVPGESLTIPTLAGRTTVYKIAQTADQSQLSLTAAAAQMTKAQTGNVTLTPTKGMAWISWTGELNEDSIIPMLPSLQMALKQDLEEQVDEILISGDTDTATTNISDTGNGAIATTWHLLMVNGLRDYALGNSNASDLGALTAEDFTTVMGLLGTNGVFALDPDKLFWIFDAGVYRKALTLGEVLTADKTGKIGTFESGRLVAVYGSDVVVSDRYGLTDTNGKINNTTSSNTKGSLLLVRPDRWVVGFGRRIVIESPARDLLQIVTDTQHLVASFRLDFKNNGEGSSLGYNVTV